MQAHIGRCSCCSHALYALHVEFGHVDMDADADTYDSLDVSSQILQNVCSGYLADPWFAAVANTNDVSYVGEYRSSTGGEVI